MSANVPINSTGIAAPTPQNTPLNPAPLAAGLSKPTVPVITEATEENSDMEITSEGALSGLQQHMAGMVQGRLAGLLGKSSGYIESLPVDIKLNVEALKGVQVKYNELQSKYRLECLALERKYLELHKPLFERRHAIITGSSTATAEEIAAGEAVSLKDDEAYIPLSKDVPPSSAGIPEFWLTALRNHIDLSELITERDAAALKHLIDVRIEHIHEEDAETKKEKLGYKILFEFSPNDFFEDKILEKTYLYGQEVDDTGEFVYDHATGTKIQWKEDKDLTKEFEIKKQRNKNTNRTRLVRKARPVDSFFNFFSPPTPQNDDGENEDLDDLLAVDCQMGEELKEKIIPRAVDYFTGKALEYEVDDEEFDEDEEDDDDDDDSGSGSVQDSESDSLPPPRGARGPAKGRRPASGGSTNPEECKQQ
jgi:nucleosome assembly protein 1-like 1